MDRKREEAERLFPTSPPPAKAKGRFRDKSVEWMQNQLQLYALAFSGIAEGIVIVFPDGVVTLFNPSAAEMFGLVDSDLEKFNMFDVLFASSEDGKGEVLKQQFLSEGRITRERTTVYHSSGKKTRVELTLVPMVTEQIEARLVITCRDVTLEEEQRRELEECAVTDPMTGFLNRRGLVASLEQIGRPRIRRDDIYVLFIDLDDFGWINKDHRMNAGDVIICQAADLLRECVRETDHVVRFGGDEFLIILEGADERSAMRVAHDVLDSLRKTSFPIEGTDDTCRVTASIGVACMPRAKYTPSQLIAKAELAKHQAKVAGKNQVCLFQPDQVGQ